MLPRLAFSYPRKVMAKAKMILKMCWGTSLRGCSNRIPWILQAPRAQCSQTHHPHHTHQAHHHYEKPTIQRLQPAMERPMAQPGMPFGTRASQMPGSRPFQSGWSVQIGQSGQKAQSGWMYNRRTALFPIPKLPVKNRKSYMLQKPVSIMYWLLMKRFVMIGSC